MTSATSPGRFRRLAAVLCISIAVLATTCAVLTGADVRRADAGTSPVRVAVTLSGVPVSARNGTMSTATLCPQAATLSLRFADRSNGKALSRRHYRIYWYGDGSSWKGVGGVSGPDGTVTRDIPGRLSGIQVSGRGYKHYFAIRYRACTTSVSRVKVSRPYGVRHDRRPHIRVAGTLYAQRSNGSVIRFPRGRVEVRDDRTRRHVATLRAAANGTFSGDVAVPATARLTLTPAGGPTGPGRPVAYGRSWVLSSKRTAVVRVPRWMTRRHIDFSPSPAFSPSVKNYRGGFADPGVMRVGRTYYAASTTRSDLNLPLMTSRDLTTWRPRAALPNYYDYSSWPSYNDAVVQAPAWAARVRTRENVKRISLWAPSLVQVRKHRFVAAFSSATRVRGGRRHSCIGLAVASAPAGPYKPFRRPLLCDPSTPFGVIDPDLFVDPRTGHAYLAWAAEGIPHRRRGQLAIRRLNRVGTAWARHSSRHDLLTFTRRWEGVIMENPSMIRYHGTLYLFYSANSFGTRRYATGYAICRSEAGPCFKPGHGPLMATRGRIAGPGGADAFVDTHGRLRLAYAAWVRGHVGQRVPGRIMHIAMLHRRPSGRLGVRRMVE